MILPRTVLGSAVILGLAAAIAGGVSGGSAFGIGVAAGAGLACADFWLLGRHVRALATAASHPTSGLVGLLAVLRLLLVAGVAWALLQRFQPLSLLVGFSSVVAAILLRAAATALRGAVHPLSE